MSCNQRINIPFISGQRSPPFVVIMYDIWSNELRFVFYCGTGNAAGSGGVLLKDIPDAVM